MKKQATQINQSAASALTVLAEAARTNPADVNAQLTAARCEINEPKTSWPAEKITAPAISRLIKFEPNKLVKGKGIFFTVWEPWDEDGTSLRMAYNVFASAKDLRFVRETGLLNFNDTARETANIRDLHGHDGGYFEDSRAIYTALRKGTYKKEWFTPTLDLLCGKDADGNSTNIENTLYRGSDEGDFKNTFQSARSASRPARWYSSSTEHPDGVFVVRFSDGYDHWGHKDTGRFSSRPCRAEPAL